MPWGIAAAAVGGLVASKGAKSAAKTQAKAGDAANIEQGRQYDLTRADQLSQLATAQQNQAPWLQAGQGALSQLTGRLPELTQAYSPQDLQNDPGYQFQLAQGLGSIRAGARGNGTLDSGATLKALMGYGQDLASTKYGEAFNRDQIQKNSLYNMLAGISGTGQTATNQLNAQGQNTMNTLASVGANSSNQIANNLTGIGNTTAAGQVASSNALGGALGTGYNAWNQQQQFNKLFGSNTYGGGNVQDQIF